MLDFKAEGLILPHLKWIWAEIKYTYNFSIDKHFQQCHYFCQVTYRHFDFIDLIVCSPHVNFICPHSWLVNYLILPKTFCYRFWWNKQSRTNYSGQPILEMKVNGFIVRLCLHFNGVVLSPLLRDFLTDMLIEE